MGSCTECHTRDLTPPSHGSVDAVHCHGHQQSTPLATPSVLVRARSGTHRKPPRTGPLLCEQQTCLAFCHAVPLPFLRTSKHVSWFVHFFRARSPNSASLRSLAVGGGLSGSSCSRVESLRESRQPPSGLDVGDATARLQLLLQVRRVPAVSPLSGKERTHGSTDRQKSFSAPESLADSRWVFPLVFSVFCVCYWLFYTVVTSADS